ncbi:hypothetical protein DPMN_013280 [Dreissena polymorpha]|uniref:Uncharacterized protein n=1 Tax=Dreissena polymorpha TaxID=45954 RepID=A0A9D4S1Q7_DREPO|nr:hypothetical protein DPMN_013280 [Dreissena polymorpha]
MDRQPHSQAFIKYDKGISYMEPAREKRWRRALEANAKLNMDTAGETRQEPRRLK